MSQISTADGIKHVRKWLESAKHVVFFTGAGMSAECGIPTFREAQTGFWARFDPMELASPEAFRRHPEQVLQWYAERRAQALACEPHAGYRAIVEIEKHTRVSVITQNVDRLHQRAGSKDVAELHGNLISESCFECHATDDGPPNTETPYQRYCRQCGGQLRPSIVWFGEALPEDQVLQAEDALVTCEVLFIVGTSAAVYPAAGMPRLAEQAGARIVLVNPVPTDHLALADVFLQGTAGELLPQLMNVPPTCLNL